MAFHLEATEVNGISTSRIIWDGASSYDANALLANVDNGERGALEEAMDFLESELDCGAVSAKEIIKRGREAGHSERTLKRAKGKLKVESRKLGHDGGWVWEISKGAISGLKAPESAEGCQSSIDGTLGTLRESGTLQKNRKTWTGTGGH